jgi:DNA-binding MarR family transcriptional regulator
MDDRATREPQADAAAVDAVLAASQTMVAVLMKSLGAPAEEATAAQYRALWVLMSRSPWRLVDLAGALGVAQSSAGRMCDRLARKGLVRRHRASGDRRTVLVSVTPAGRRVGDEAAGRHRALIAEILGRLPLPAQQAVAQALRAFADAAGEVPDSEWPAAVPAGEGPTPRRRGSAERGGPELPVPPARDRAKERA